MRLGLVLTKLSRGKNRDGRSDFWRIWCDCDVLNLEVVSWVSTVGPDIANNFFVGIFHLNIIRNRSGSTFHLTQLLQVCRDIEFNGSFNCHQTKECVHEQKKIIVLKETFFFDYAVEIVAGYHLRQVLGHHILVAFIIFFFFFDFSWLQRMNDPKILELSQINNLNCNSNKQHQRFHFLPNPSLVGWTAEKSESKKLWTTLFTWSSLKFDFIFCLSFWLQNCKVNSAERQVNSFVWLSTIRISPS